MGTADFCPTKAPDVTLTAYIKDDETRLSIIDSVTNQPVVVSLKLRQKWNHRSGMLSLVEFVGHPEPVCLQSRSISPFFLPGDWLVKRCS